MVKALYVSAHLYNINGKPSDASVLDVYLDVPIEGTASDALKALVVDVWKNRPDLWKEALVDISHQMFPKDKAPPVVVKQPMEKMNGDSESTS
jgi:hypothetical protein